MQKAGGRADVSPERGRGRERETQILETPFSPPPLLPGKSAVHHISFVLQLGREGATTTKSQKRRRRRRPNVRTRTIR